MERYELGMNSCTVAQKMLVISGTLDMCACLGGC
jgi:hypothetical protein